MTKHSMNSYSQSHLVACVVLLGSLLAAQVSAAAEPSKAECLTASEAWLKLRANGQLRDARAQLLLCAAESCPADVRNECASHIADVNAAIPSIVFVAKDAAGNDLAAVTLLVDGKALSQKLDGSAISVDPGEHTFTFKAAGQTSIDRRFVIHEGEKDRRETILIGTGSAVGTPVSGSANAERPKAGGSSASGALGSRRILALAIAGAGLAGIAAGSVFVADAMAKWTQAKRDCGSGCLPDAPAQTERRDAEDAAMGANIAYAAAGVALVAGAVLWFTAPVAGTVGTVTVRTAPSGLGSPRATLEFAGTF